jgi:hypothetical protein
MLLIGFESLYRMVLTARELAKCIFALEIMDTCSGDIASASALSAATVTMGDDE